MRYYFMSPVDEALPEDEQLVARFDRRLRHPIKVTAEFEMLRRTLMVSTHQFLAENKAMLSNQPKVHSLLVNYRERQHSPDVAVLSRFDPEGFQSMFSTIFLSIADSSV